MLFVCYYRSTTIYQCKSKLRVEAGERSCCGLGSYACPRAGVSIYMAVKVASIGDHSELFIYASDD